MIFFHRLKYPNLYHGRHRKGLWPVWTHKLLWHFHCDFTVFFKNAVFWHPSIHTCNFLNDLLSFKGLGSGVTVLIFSWTTHYTVAVELFVMATCLSTHLIITYLSTPLWASNPRGVASRLDMRLGGRGGGGWNHCLTIAELSDQLCYCKSDIFLICIGMSKLAGKLLQPILLAHTKTHTQVIDWKTI